MLKEILEETEAKMKKTTEVFRGDLARLKAGRASPALLERVLVDYYGVATPVNQLANISVPEPRLLVIQPWDKSAIAAVEKAIMKSDLGLTPNNDGQVIRLNIPQLTEERRQELAKQVRRMAEDARVVIRNHRRDANDLTKELEKAGDISEDDSRRTLDDIQKLTDRYIKEVDRVTEAKEQEIMEV